MLGAYAKILMKLQDLCKILWLFLYINLSLLSAIIADTKFFLALLIEAAG